MRAAAPAAIVLAACSHGEPLGAPDQRTANPPQPAFGMRRLTFNTEGEWAPAWLPDTSRIGFTWRVPGRADRDRCVGIMPLATSRIERLLCHGGARSADSTNAIFSQAFSPGGRVAWIEAEGRIGFMASDRVLAVGPADGSAPARNVLSFPMLMANGVLHNGASHLAWTGESTLVYMGTLITYVTGVPEAVDTTETGLQLVQVDLRTLPATATLVPNSDSVIAMSVDPVTQIAYAVFHDSVFSIDLATGQRTLALKLTALAPVRDINVMNNRLVAVVGGIASHISGRLAVADLPGGAVVLLPLPPPPLGPGSGFLFARPALARSGDYLVAETFTFTNFLIPPGPARDTVLHRASDLYLVTVP